MCAVCGENFLLNILTNEKVKTFNVDGISSTLYAHKNCMKTLTNCSGEKWRDLPAKSPLRRAFEKANDVESEAA